jgi:hypothetical protein
MWKIAASVSLSLYMRDNGKIRHLHRLQRYSILSLSVTKFQRLKRAGVNDPEGPEKSNNTEVKNF